MMRDTTSWGDEFIPLLVDVNARVPAGVSCTRSTKSTDPRFDSTIDLTITEDRSCLRWLMWNTSR